MPRSELLALPGPPYALGQSSARPSVSGDAHRVPLAAAARAPMLVVAAQGRKVMASTLVVDALNMAIWNRRPSSGLVHYSDHGAQYTSLLFGRTLREAGVAGSMGSVGDAYDNALAESFFATLQTELLDRHNWATRQQLASSIFEYVEAFYNRRRLHSALGYLSPDDFERKWEANREVEDPLAA